ncbi:MAG: aldehyde dehydrogenase family protein [Myxococcota bacterium]
MNLHQKLLNAKHSQPSFEALGFQSRAILLKKAGFEMLRRHQEVAQLLHEEAYKIYPEILLSEAIGPLQFIKDWIKVARPFLKTQRVPISALAFPGKKAWRTQVPRGVVGIITPFNYPFGNFFKPVFAALLSGNAVIIKPSEYTPNTADWFVEIMNQFLPAGVLSLHHGGGAAGEELILSGIDAITFTGSFQTGQKVALLAAQKMIPCSFELGGKDAAVVLADCDLDRTVAGILHWAFHNAGQSCGAVDRVYVEDAIADVFIARLTAAAHRLQGQVSKVVPPHHPAFLSELIEDAINKGATCHPGLEPGSSPLHNAGSRVKPGMTVILDRCDHSMRIMREPTFGPLLPIMRVQSAAQAISLVNDNDYGLNASVWSRNIKKATAIAERFQVGTAYVNNHSFTGAVPAAPWTGTKQSGYGIANSEFSLAHYTRPRTLVIDRKKTADAWWFPMNRLAARLGECLAKAQLGDLKAAIQIPMLIFRRQREVLAFVKPKKTLFAFEAAWGQAATEALFFAPEKNSEFTTVGSAESQAFVDDMHASMTFPGNFGLRASLWLIGLSPLWKFRALKTLGGVTIEKRAAILEELFQSNSYLQRQLALMIKMNGTFLHTSTTRVHQILANKK